VRRPRLGALRYRARLEAPVCGGEEGCTAGITWEPVATLWAEIRSLSGQEVVRADGIFALGTYEVRIRFRNNITPHMRFVIGGRVFDIRAVRDMDGRRRFLTCLCEEQYA